MTFVLLALYFLAGLVFMVYVGHAQARWQFDGKPSPFARVLVIGLWPFILISLLAS